MGYLVTSEADVEGRATLHLEMRRESFTIHGDDGRIELEYDRLGELASLVEDAVRYNQSYDAFMLEQKRRAEELEAREAGREEERRTIARHAVARHGLDPRSPAIHDPGWLEMWHRSVHDDPGSHDHDMYDFDYEVVDLALALDVFLHREAE